MSLQCKHNQKRLSKKRSAILSNYEETGPVPKRKCISFDDGHRSNSRVSLNQRFKILGWKSLTDHEEEVVVVFNECVTLKIRLSLPRYGEGSSDNWSVTGIDYRIFAMDNNIHSILRASIDYVIKTYPSCDLVNFLGLLFIIHNDALEFYKQCRNRFGLAIKVDSCGWIKIKLNENGVEVQMNVFDDSIVIETSQSMPCKINVPVSRAGVKLLRSNSKEGTSISTPFNRALLDILTSTIRFAKNCFELARPRELHPSLGSFTLSIDS